MTALSLDQRRYDLRLTLRQLADLSGLPFNHVMLTMGNERASLRSAKILDEVLTRLETEPPPKAPRAPRPPKPKAVQKQPDHHHLDDERHRSPQIISRAELMWAEGFRRIGRNYAGPLRSGA